MFHLLVSYGGWKERCGKLLTSRVYIKQGVEHEKRFLRPDGRLNVEAIISIPALLVAETGSDDIQQARVAQITNIQQDDRTTVINYTIDPNIPPISNQKLEQHYSQSGSGNVIFSHTCWRVKDEDLYKIILSSMQRNPLQPSVFSISRTQANQSRFLSVMMPFSSDFNNVYAAIKNAAEQNGMTCARADNIWEEHTIIQDVVNLIVKANVIVCDCTGKNPNVFYEIGIAHTLGKEVILLTQHQEDVPFDLQHLRHIKYLNNEQGCERLFEEISSRLQTILSRQQFP
jgi:hypothetical protein